MCQHMLRDTTSSSQKYYAFSTPQFQYGETPGGGALDRCGGGGNCHPPLHPVVMPLVEKKENESR